MAKVENDQSTASTVQAVQPLCMGFKVWYVKTQYWKETQNINSANSENTEENITSMDLRNTLQITLNAWQKKQNG